MTSLIIIAILTIGAVGTAGYTAFSLYKTTDSLSQMQRNGARMEQLATIVEANLRPVNFDGIYYAPAEEPSHAGHPGLPKWLAPAAVTPWGVPYRYCAYAPNAPAATGHRVEKSWSSAGKAKSQRHYVTANETLPAMVSEHQVLALIVSPGIDGKTPPECNQVVFREGRFSVPGGSVVAVTRRSAMERAAVMGTAPVERHVGPLATGDGSGGDAGNLAALQDALALWQATAPAVMVVRFQPGIYALTAAEAQALLGAPLAGGARRLVLRGQEDGQAVIAAEGGDYRLAVPVDTRIEGLSFTGIALEVPPGIRLELAGNNALGPVQGSPPLRSTFGSLMVGGRLAIAAGGEDAILVRGGMALFRDAEVSLAVGGGHSGMIAGSAANIALDGDRQRTRFGVSAASGVALAAIRAGGTSITIDNADVILRSATQYGIVLEQGSLGLTRASIGAADARPLVAAIADGGGLSAQGDLATLLWASNQGRCVDGPLFAPQASPRMVATCRH